MFKNFDTFEYEKFKVLVGGDKNIKDNYNLRKFIFSYSSYNKILKKSL